VPYRGSAPALNDLVAGQVAAMFVNTASSADLIREGRLRALAIGSRAPSPVLPGVPTLSQALGKDMEAGVWFGLLAPKGTDGAIVRRVSGDVSWVLGDHGRAHEIGSAGRRGRGQRAGRVRGPHSGRARPVGAGRASVGRPDRLRSTRMSVGATRLLAELVAGTRREDLPAEVRHEGVRSFVNWLGCAIGGARHPGVAAAARVAAAAFGGAPGATLWGCGGGATRWPRPW
jgi:hypothetical protein